MKPGYLGCGCTSDQTYLKINPSTECVKISCQAEECDREEVLIPSLSKYLDGSDVGFAELAERKLYGEVFYSETSNCFYVWNAGRRLYQVDRKGGKLKTRINHALSKSIDAHNINILKSLPDNKERDGLLKHIKKMRKQVRTNSCLNQIVDYLKGGIMISEDFTTHLDKAPHLIPTKGGTVVDCKTGKVRKRTKEDLFSFELGFNYSDDVGPFPQWITSLFDIYKDKKACTLYLQMLLGYFMTGETREQTFVVFQGNRGKNGKGVILNLLESVMGDFIYKMNKGLVIHSEKCSNRGASLAKLVFSRLSYIDETRKEDRFKDDFVKDISGEGKLTYRPLYQSERTIDVNCKFLCITNFAPKFDGTDQAIARRILIIPFLKYFRTKNEAGYNPNDKYCVTITDNNFKYELLEQRAQFFNFVVAGAIRYYKHLGQLIDMMPKTFKTARKDYIHSNDPVQQFVEEFCEVGDYRVTVLGFQIKLRKENGLGPEYTSQMITKIMQEKGFDKRKARENYGGTSYNTKCYIGIRIIPTEVDY